MRCDIFRSGITVLFLLLSFQLYSKQYVVSGYVRDNSSNESLISATVFDTISTKGIITNAYRYYTIILQEGDVNLRFSYSGYQTQYCKFDLKKDTLLNVSLSPVTELSEVVVVGDRKGLAAEGNQMSAISIPKQVIQNLPSLAGEVDVIKSIQLLPGVQSGSEGSTGLYVRGGGPDENLILLDGVPLYNVNHLGGLFSVFNADAIKDVTLYKGNFPARFGSRLSSVLDVRQNDGNAKTYHGTVSVGLLATRSNFEGPIYKEKTTFNISARRTYFDLLMQPIIMSLGAGDNALNTAGYYFYDLNARFSHKFSESDRLTVSFYSGDDAAYFNYRYKDKSELEKNNFGLRWGNIVTSVNWSHVYNSKLFSELMVSYTRYRFRVNTGYEYKNKEDSSYTESFGMKFSSNVDDVTAQYNLDYNPHPNHYLKFGVNYIFHIFKPSVMTYKYQMEAIPLDTTIGAKQLYTHETALYAEDTWDIHKRVKLNYGLRGSFYFTDKKVYPSVEPRVGLRLLLMKDFSFKASYSFMSQYIHLLSSSNLTLPTDLWVPVTSKIPAMKSHQVAGGLFYDLLNQVHFSVEAYYKLMNNIIEYKDGSSYMLSPEGWEEKVVVGKGWSYGVEFLIQRNIGKISGWIAYTWSKSQRLFDREGMVLNYGKPFYAKYDRRHDLSIVLIYKPTKKIDLSATFIYATGNRGSLSTQVAPDGTPLYEERNNYSLPDYHRLDLGINFHFARKKQREGEHILNISCYNVYNHKNPYMVYVDGNDLIGVSLFPIIPSISYTFKF